MTVPLLGIALAGCNRGGDGTDGVATAGGQQPAANTDANQASEDPQERARQFAECMRGEGVDMPDPETADGGKIRLRIGGAEGAEVDKEKLNAAMEKCRKYLPNGGEPRQLSPEDLERMRAFAQCMRDNGVPDYPDPDPNGGFAMRVEDKAGAPQGEAARAAMEKCRQHLPDNVQRKTG